MPETDTEWRSMTKWMANEWRRLSFVEKSAYLEEFRRRLIVHKAKVKIRLLGIKNYRGLVEL